MSSSDSPRSFSRRSAPEGVEVRRWLPLLCTGLVYLAAWGWGEVMGYPGTANWVGHNLLLFAVLSLVAVWRGGWWAAAWTMGGLVAGVVLGNLIGDPIYQGQLDQLARQRLDPGYRQDWEPHHPGWAIACGVFLVASVVGGLHNAERLRSRHPLLPV